MWPLIVRNCFNDADIKNHLIPYIQHNKYNLNNTYKDGFIIKK